MKPALLAFTGLALLVSPLVKGGDQLFHNGIEETRGISAPHGDFASALKFNKHGTRLLVGVKWHGFHEDAEPDTGWRLFWVESTMKLNPNPDGSKRLTAYDIVASLVTRVGESAYFSDEEFAPVGFLKVGQAQLTRDVDTDSGRFTLKAFEVGGTVAANSGGDDASLMATLSLDALGYSLVKRYKNPTATQGLHVLGFNGTLSAGVNLPKKLSLQIAVSGSADIATNGLLLAAFVETALMKRSKRARGSLFFRFGGEAEEFYDTGIADPNPLTRVNEATNESAAFMMTGLNFSW